MGEDRHGSSDHLALAGLVYEQFVLPARRGAQVRDEGGEGQVRYQSNATYCEIHSQQATAQILQFRRQRFCLSGDKTSRAQKLNR